jgi:adenine phosphoribosyltransferase
MSVKEQLTAINQAITLHTNFPKEGVTFHNINPLLKDPKLMGYVETFIIQILSKERDNFDIIAGAESRGFFFAHIAQKLNKGFTMVRKDGKLPSADKIQGTTEYSNISLCIEGNLFNNERILFIDDLLATGGSFLAVKDLFENIGCQVYGGFFLIDLIDIQRKEGINNYKIFKLLSRTSTSQDFLPKDVVQLLTPVRYYPFDINRPNAKFIVFSGPSMERLAESIAHCHNFREGLIKRQKFPDTALDVTMEEGEYLEDKDVIYLLSTTKEEDFFTQLSELSILPKYGIHSLHIFIPYFKYGTMERVGKRNVIATAETYAHILSSSIPMTKTGPAIIHTLEPHTLIERFYYKNVYVRPHTIVNDIITEDMTLCYPDDGAAKRYTEYFPDNPYVVCSKKRDGDKRYITISQCVNVREKKKITIIDDLVQTGSTLLECAKVLKAEGFEEVEVFVTHAVFPNNAHLRFINSDISHVTVTNSNPEVADKLRKIDMFKVIDIAPFIIEKVYKGPVGFLPLYKIYVASENECKLSAVYRAFFTIFSHIKVYGINVPSSVSEHPVNGETRIGCRNRLKHLEDIVEDKNAFLISIENGMFNENNIVVDQCCVMIKYKVEVWENPIMYPTQITDLDLIQESNNGTSLCTLIKNRYRCKDWHKKFPPYQTREEQIITTILDYIHKVILLGN